LTTTLNIIIIIIIIIYYQIVLEAQQSFARYFQYHDQEQWSWRVERNNESHLPQRFLHMVDC